MSRLLFVDTSAWIAGFSHQETRHAEVKKILAEAAAASPGRLLTSDYVVDELLTLIQRKRGHAMARQIGDAVWRNKGAILLDVDASVRETAWSLFVKFGEHRVSFTDCTTAALMRLQGIDEIVSLDRHFDLFGFNRLPA